MQIYLRTTTTYKPLQPLTTQRKLQIIQHMQLVPLNTAWGYAVKDFLENGTKTDKELEELLRELFADIQHGPNIMRQVLGSAYQFFCRLSL